MLCACKLDFWQPDCLPDIATNNGCKLDSK